MATVAEQIAEKQSELADVKSAISAVLRGERETMRGRRQFSDVDLSTLRLMKTELEGDIARLSGAAPRILHITPLG